MRKFRIITLIVVAITLSATSAFAQLTTGESSATKIRTGNRPGEGDWGVFLGVAYSDFENIFDEEITFEGFPLVNVKYYYTDEIELRLGIQLQGSSEKLSGELNTSNDGTTDVKVTTKERKRFITPGIAYHFSNDNLLDVYAGASLPIGYNIYKTVSESDDYSTKSTRSPFTVGLGGFIGLQTFIADLPVSLGVEYGISYMKQFGNDKVKVVSEDDDNKQTYYIYQGDLSGFSDGSATFDELSTSKSILGNDVRVTLTYYFSAN